MTYMVYFKVSYESYRYGMLNDLLDGILLVWEDETALGPSGGAADEFKLVVDEGIEMVFYLNLLKDIYFSSFMFVTDLWCFDDFVLYMELNMKSMRDQHCESI